MSKRIQHSISNTQYPVQGGFTLVELLVTLGIFMVLTAVVLANYRTYNTNALFSNASEDIVLALRQAQVYGVGTKVIGSSFMTPYGVHFDTATPSKIIIFADRGVSPDGKYVAGDDDPIIETISWGSAVSSMTLTCGVVACGGGVASVTFKRPNPDAIIRDSSGASPNEAVVAIVGVTKTSKVFISTAGQISLK